MAYCAAKKNIFECCEQSHFLVQPDKFLMNWPISWKLRNLMDLVCIPSFIPLIKKWNFPCGPSYELLELIHEAAFSRGWMKMKAKFPWCCIKFNLISSKDDWLNNKDTPGLFMCIGYGCIIWWNLALSIPIPSWSSGHQSWIWHGFI